MQLRLHLWQDAISDNLARTYVDGFSQIVYRILLHLCSPRDILIVTVVFSISGILSGACIVPVPSMAVPRGVLDVMIGAFASIGVARLQKMLQCREQAHRKTGTLGQRLFSWYFLLCNTVVLLPYAADAKRGGGFCPRLFLRLDAVLDYALAPL